MYIFLTLIMLSSTANTLNAKCVEELLLNSSEINQLKTEKIVRIDLYNNGIFKPFSPKMHLAINKKFNVQLIPPFKLSHLYSEQKKSRYIKYYNYQELLSFIDKNKKLINKFKYGITNLGKSIQGRNIFAIHPQVLSKKKQTIIMLGRHHGDEGSANWIIEGFAKEFFKKENQFFRDRFQLVLIPMINPDGAVARTRYNSNGRDLNRAWEKKSANSHDEIHLIHKYIENIKNSTTNYVIALDMHGSFTEDFIYRVNKKFINEDFFIKQGNFIEQLGIFDSYQNSSFRLSNGNPKMMRILFVRDYAINALTHETIRDIPKGQGRTIQSLKEQGNAIYQSILNLY